MKLSQLIQSLKDNNLFQREFIVNDTLKLISANKIWFWSWGSNNFKNIENKGLLFDVRGHLHSGKVLITLAWDDTYTITLIKTTGKIKETITNIYFDELAERIDRKIERIDAYKN